MALKCYLIKERTLGWPRMLLRTWMQQMMVNNLMCVIQIIFMVYKIVDLLREHVTKVKICTQSRVKPENDEVWQVHENYGKKGEPFPDPKVLNLDGNIEKKLVTETGDIKTTKGLAKAIGGDDFKSNRTEGKVKVDRFIDILGQARY